MQCTLCQCQASTRVEVQVNSLIPHFNCKVSSSSWAVTLQCVIVLTLTSTSAAVIQFSQSLDIALSRLWQISSLMWIHSFYSICVYHCDALQILVLQLVFRLWLALYATLLMYRGAPPRSTMVLQVWTTVWGTGWGIAMICTPQCIHPVPMLHCEV